MGEGQRKTNLKTYHNLGLTSTDKSIRRALDIA